MRNLSNLYIDGVVGIGTTSPIGKLQIGGTSGNLLTVGTLTNNWAGEVAIGVTNGNGVIISKVNTANDTNRVLVFYRDDTNGGTIFGYTPSGGSTDVGFQLRASGTSYFNGGNVGIGTTSPAGRLEISQNLSAAETIDYPLVISSKDDNNGINQLGGEGVGIKFRIAGNDATDPGNSLVGASIAAIRKSSSDSESDTHLAFFTSQNDEVLDEAMRITSDGRVGIGTTNPTLSPTSYTGALHVENDTYIQARLSSSSSGAGLEFIPSSGDHWEIQAQTGNSLIFYNRTDGSYRLVIDGGGNIGVGTTSPAAKMHIGPDALVSGYTTTRTTLAVSDTTNGAELILRGQSPRIWFDATAAGNGEIYMDGASLDILSGTPTSAGSSRFNIDSSGNVGIGTSSPTSKTHVYYGGGTTNGLHVQASVNRSKILVSDNDTAAYMIAENSLASFGRQDALSSNNLNITNGGNVLIGTTTDSGDKLNVAGTISAAGTINLGTGGSGSLELNGVSVLSRSSTYTQLKNPEGAITLYLGDSADRTNYYDNNTHIFRHFGGSPTYAVINSSGNLGIGTTSPGSVLDIRRDGGGSSNPIPLTSWYGGNGGGNLVAKLEYTADAGIFTIGYAGLASWDTIVLDGGTSNGGSSIALKDDTVTTVYLRSSSGNNYINSGNVGIGTTSPTTKLDVNGVITATGGNSTQWNTAYSWGDHSTQSYATQSYVTTAISNLVDSAPSTLDTLNELAAALGDDPNFATTVTNSIASKVPQTRTLTINGTAYDLSADRSWTIATTTPGGSDTQFQYNSSGSLAGASALTYNSANNRIGVNQASPGYDFDVNGQVRVQDKLRVGTVNSGNGVVHMSSSATINPNTTTIVWAQNVSVGMCAFIEYYILNNNSLTDQRAGTIIVTWNQSGTPTIAHTETTTPDIGSTTAVNFTSSLVGSDARINAVNSSANPYTIVMSYKYF